MSINFICLLVVVLFFGYFIVTDPPETSKGGCNLKEKFKKWLN